MTRVPARLVLELLRQEAERTGDQRYRVKHAALRTWVYRRHITRGTGGYDLREILVYLDRRSHPVVTGRVSHLTAAQGACDAA